MQLDTYLREMLASDRLVVTDTSRALARAFARWTMALRAWWRVLPPIARQFPIARRRDAAGALSEVAVQ